MLPCHVFPWKFFFFFVPTLTDPEVSCNPGSSQLLKGDNTSPNLWSYHISSIQHKVHPLSPNAVQISIFLLPIKLLPVSCLTSIRGIRVIREDMGEKEGILQFLFHCLMICQQPRHVACLECLSLHSGHGSYCVRRGKKGIYVAVSVHTHTAHTHTF